MSNRENLVETRCPESGRETIAFKRHMSMDGISKPEVVGFDRDVVWIRESESKMLFKHGGAVLKEGSTHNDFYGFLTSFNSLLEDVDEIVQGYAITPESSLVLEIETLVFDAAVLPTDQEPVIRNRRCYQNLPDSWFIVDEAEKKEYDAGKERPSWMIYPPLTRLSNREIARETTWSSRMTAAQSAEIFEKLKASVTPAL